MPAPFVAADVKSPSLAGALVEIAIALTNAEKTVPIETRPERVSVTYSYETEEVTVTATIPAEGATDATGKGTIAAIDYIP